MQKWRLISDEAASGSWNMAVDTVVLEAYRRGESPPTLRLYDWAQPTLSLGYAQKLVDVNQEACAVRGVALVRRPTGGRAVLHGVGDLTYAVVASEQEGFPGHVSGSYCLIAKAIVRALRKLQIDVALAPGTQAPTSTSACFSTSTEADLVANGRKLVGSAQVRRDGGFLQHGALMLSQDPGAIGPFLHDSGPTGMTSLQALLGTVPSREQIRAALMAGFQEAFDIEWSEAILSSEEQRHAAQLEASFRLT